MYLSNNLPLSDIKKIHAGIINKLRYWSPDLINLKTDNDQLQTKIFPAINDKYKFLAEDISLDTNEFPFLECRLDNGNYFLMTTERMISKFNNQYYELCFDNYKGQDHTILNQAKPIELGKTKVFRHFSQDGKEFWYEIDSYIPAFYANHVILSYMNEAFQRVKFGTLYKASWLKV